MVCVPGGRNREYAVVETVVHNGVEYRRYPNARRRNNRVYFVATGGAHLHRVIYEENFGPIPEGHHVHHKDGNPLNNDPSNLEAKTAFDHLSEHMQERPDEYWERQSKHLEAIRPLASEWHRSDEGRDWHRGHAKVLHENKTPVSLTCIQCGKAYEGYRTSKPNKFCSRACCSAFRRDSGIDDEDRTCVVCGILFRVNKYSKQTCCSTVCAGRRAQQAIHERTKDRPPVRKSCEWCKGEFFDSSPLQQKRFCNKVCYRKFRSEYPDQCDRKNRRQTSRPFLPDSA